MFSLSLSSKDGDDKSKLIFGGWDPAYTEDKIHWIPVVKKGYWAISLERIYIGNKDTGLCTETKPCAAAIDSGTSFFTGPTSQVSKLLSLIEGEDCRKMPPLNFHMNGKNFTLGSSDYIIEQDDIYSIFNLFSGANSDNCVSNFYPLDVDPPYGPIWVLGDSFMSKYHIIFDRDHDRVGLVYLSK